MSLGEFSVIEQFFSRPVSPEILGVGDDAARLSLPPNTDLVCCKDLLVEGRHFFPNVDPFRLGHKSLAVNLSDLAALGATPLACLLGVGLPRVDSAWLEAFTNGFYHLADQWHCPLIGGDTVSSAHGITISVTALGFLPKDQPGLRRDCAKAGDDLWVSGDLGAADVALKVLSGELDVPSEIFESIRSCLEQPEPRVALGRALLPLAHAAIDISDGLVQDLQHLLKASHCGAVLDWDSLPVHPSINALNRQGILDDETIKSAVLRGGDVYELCFTAPSQHRQSILALGNQLPIALSRIGTVSGQSGLSLRSANGESIVLAGGGFDHFNRLNTHD